MGREGKTLSEEERAQHDPYKETWFRWGVNTERADKEKAERAIAEMYQIVSLPPPKFHWTSSLLGALRKIHELKKSPKGVSITSELGNEWWGQHEAYWLCVHIFAQEVLKVKYAPLEVRKLALWANIAKACCWWWPYKEHCVISDRPTFVGMNAQRRIHNESGPCVAFGEEFQIWAWNNVLVPRQVIEAPETLTVQQIMKEPNSERRRIMVLRKNPAVFFKEAGAKIIHQDEDKHGPRTLYKFTFPEGEAAGVAVKTVRKDGGLDDFLLWVPTSTETCAEGVASTFRVKRYKPINES